MKSPRTSGTSSGSNWNVTYPMITPRMGPIIERTGVGSRRGSHRHPVRGVPAAALRHSCGELSPRTEPGPRFRSRRPGRAPYLVAHRVAYVEGVDHAAVVRRDLRHVHIELELGERARDVVQPADTVGRRPRSPSSSPTPRCRPGRRRGPALAGGIPGPLLRDPLVERERPSTALRSMARNSRHRASSTSGSKTPSTSKTSTATASSVVNAWALRFESPASETAPAIPRTGPAGRRRRPVPRRSPASCPARGARTSFDSRSAATVGKWPGGPRRLHRQEVPARHAEDERRRTLRLFLASSSLNALEPGSALRELHADVAPVVTRWTRATSSRMRA